MDLYVPIALVDGAQSVEREHVIYGRYVLRFIRDQVCEAAGGDTFRFRSELGNHALQNAIDQANVSVEETDLQIVDSVGADDLRRALNLNSR